MPSQSVLASMATHSSLDESSVSGRLACIHHNTAPRCAACLDIYGRFREKHLVFSMGELKGERWAHYLAVIRRALDKRIFPKDFKGRCVHGIKPYFCGRCESIYTEKSRIEQILTSELNHAQFIRFITLMEEVYHAQVQSKGESKE